jgi:hypothetical protein
VGPRAGPDAEARGKILKFFILGLRRIILKPTLRKLGVVVDWIFVTQDKARRCVVNTSWKFFDWQSDCELSKKSCAACISVAL